MKSFIPLVVLLLGLAAESRGAVVYEFKNSLSGVTTVSFSKSVGQYLTLGQSLTFSLTDVSVGGGLYVSGTPSSMPVALTLTQTTGGIVVSSFSLDFNPLLVTSAPQGSSNNISNWNFQPSPDVVFSCAVGSNCDAFTVSGSVGTTGTPSGSFAGTGTRVIVSGAADPVDSSVPEPATVALVGAALGVVLWRRR